MVRLNKYLAIVVLALIITTSFALAVSAKNLPISTYLPFNKEIKTKVNMSESYIYPDGGDYIYISYKENAITGERGIRAQRIDKDGKERWKKEYDLKGNNTLQMIHLHKNGFIMIVHNLEARENKLWAVGIGNNGEIVWKQEIALDKVTSITNTNDDGFVIAGTVGKENQNIKILKVDKKGNWQSGEKSAAKWEKTYSDKGKQEASQIIQVLDKDNYNDGYLLTGYTDYNTNGKEDLYLLRLDAYGEVKWSKNYGGKGNDQGVSILPFDQIKSDDTGYIVTGNTETSSGDKKMYLLYIDKYGYTQSWPDYLYAPDGAKERQLGSGSDLMTMAIVPVPDGFKNNRKLRGEKIAGQGGALLLGYSEKDSKVLAIRISEIGHVLWEKGLALPGDNLLIGTIARGSTDEQVIAYSAIFPPSQRGDMQIHALSLYLEGGIDQEKVTPKQDQLESNHENIKWKKRTLSYEAMRDISKEIKDLLSQQPHTPLVADTVVKGEIEWPDNSYYLGNLVIGKADGEGTLFFTNGVWYKGAWKNNMFYGKGLLRFPTGEYYEGDFDEHMMQGKGIFKWPTGEKYAGEFKYNQREGQGIFTWPNGTYYQGGFEDNNAHGNGAIYWSNGERYEGQMVSGSATGQGSYYFPTGERYRGEFSSLTFQGVGVYHWPDGSYYVGQFANDRFNGEGYYVWPNGVMQHGYWKDDKYMGTNPNYEKGRSNW